jgi:4-amino-4-deoxy-L-arabinose transferase-like glycosyltransferase
MHLMMTHGNSENVTRQSTAIDKPIRNTRVPQKADAARIRLMTKAQAATLRKTALIAIILAGIFIRIIYVEWTRFDTREHDVWSHIEYVQFVADNWTLPDPHASSQFYHPPLYYFLTAPVLRLALDAGWERDAGLLAVQKISLLLSIITYLIAVFIGSMLFDRKKDPRALPLYCAIMAVYPALVFYSARINNDALYQLEVFGGAALLLLYWQSKRARYWYLLWAVLGLGLLTKTHAILLAPLALACITFIKKMTWQNKFKHAALGVGVMLLVGGWFHGLRYINEHNSRTTLIGNVNILTNFVDNGPRAFLTFNPIQMVMHPYNDPFNDEARRQYFWEYLLRSGLFGEYNFGQERVALARAIVTAQLLLLLGIIWAAWNYRKKMTTDLPVWLLTALVLLAHAAFRLFYPYSSSQDFRYSILLSLSIAYFSVLGIAQDRPAIKWARLAAALLLIITCVIFLLDLYPRG